jgi:hypothetical protein
MTSGQGRLDAFTDAAFAFAVTLMVAGTGGMAPDYRQLEAAIAGAPSFAIAFGLHRFALCPPAGRDGFELCSLHCGAGGRL